MRLSRPLLIHLLILFQYEISSRLVKAFPIRLQNSAAAWKNNGSKRGGGFDVSGALLVGEGVNEQEDTRTQKSCITGVAPRSGALNEAVAAITGVSLNDANNLINIGAVWAKLELLSPDDILSQYDEDGLSSNARALYADLPPGWGSNDHSSLRVQNASQDGEDLEGYVQMMEHQRYRRVLTETRVDAGTDLRIYPQPRRFPSCYQMSRTESLLYEDTTFIVVDKPPMLPTQPDASNYQECCPGCVQHQMGPFQDIDGNLVVRPLLCHRVDACVGGCVVLSKDRNGQKVFQELQRDRKLRKIYLAVTKQPVPTGLHVHWMWAPQSQRGAVGGPPCQLVSHRVPESRRKARQFWKRCVLEVVKSEPIKTTIDDDSIYYESTIRLVTGRKHQVRSQLASLGCPIIRDSLYEPISGMTLEMLEDEQSHMDKQIQRCKIPTQPIGLQAAGILFGGIKALAKEPWWRTESHSQATGTALV